MHLLSIQLYTFTHMLCQVSGNNLILIAHECISTNNTSV